MRAESCPELPAAVLLSGVTALTPSNLRASFLFSIRPGLHFGIPQSSESSMELKLCPDIGCSLDRANPLWLLPWFRCWSVTELSELLTHPGHQIETSAGGNPFPRAQMNPCHPLELLRSLGTHLLSRSFFSKCSHESAHTYLILFITNESSNTISWDRMLPVHDHITNSEKLLDYTACFLKSSEVPTLVTFKIVYLRNILRESQRPVSIILSFFLSSMNRYFKRALAVIPN